MNCSHLIQCAQTYFCDAKGQKLALTHYIAFDRLVGTATIFVSIVMTWNDPRLAWDVEGDKCANVVTTWTGHVSWDIESGKEIGGDSEMTQYYLYGRIIIFAGDREDQNLDPGFQSL